MRPHEPDGFMDDEIGTPNLEVPAGMILPGMLNAPNPHAEPEGFMDGEIGTPNHDEVPFSPAPALPAAPAAAPPPMEPVTEMTEQSEQVDMSLLMGARFTQGKQGNEGCAPVSPYEAVSLTRGQFQAVPVDTGPPLPAGRGSHDALTEGVIAGARAMMPQTAPVRRQAPASAPLTERATRKPKKRARGKSGVLEGDVLQHKPSGKLAKVVESTKSSMTVELDGMGLIEVSRGQAKDWKLIGKGV